MDRRDFLKAAGAGAMVMAAPGSLLAALSGLTAEEVERRVAEVVPKLTLSEKIDLMAGKISRTLLGAFGVGDGGHGYTGQTVGNARLGIPRVLCTDGPRGVGFMYTATCFPVGMCRGAAWDPELEARVGSVMGYEERAIGGNMLLAPCINVLWHPRWGRAQETYGEDPYHLGAMGAGFVNGVQEHVMACAKHYAVNNVEDSRMFVNAVVDERTLREIFLPHFKKCVDAKVASVMSAYNDVNGDLCSDSMHLMRDILKGEWEFDGFVVSDWENAVEDTVGAAKAGLDLEMPRAKFYGRKLKAAVESGQVPESVIDEAASRMCRQLFRFVGPDFAAGYDKKRMACPEHAAVALESARKGIVLLKNENSALPLVRGEVKTVAVLGEVAKEKNIGDHGSSIVRPPYIVSALEGLTDRAGSVRIIYESGKNLAAAKAAAGKADAVVVVAGYTYKEEGEGRDRASLALPDAQQSLILAAAEANQRCVVVLESGSAIAMDPWIGKVPAVVMAWYPGMEGGHAIADVVFGDVNPSGKLPIVFPRSEDQLAKFDNGSKEVKYGRYHGYRYMEKHGAEPLFPFGFGLSYTTYQYANLKLDKKSAGRSGKVVARVDVTNTGKMAGEEVVELYAGCPGSKVDRAKKELKGFARVALAPGETKTVAIELSVPELAYYNVDAGAWEVEEAEYIISLGPSSCEDDLLKERLKVTGA
ncbi:MAG TPA: glycoside hydrolase family 3 C-terminal domain-containing protein [bacterium]|nr:glycoside hydrolase family 3 C-terminal domain-containing protein [bacterium]